jgi:DNA/RNA endonuclease YhcR with UshA esterase domain
MEGIGLQRPRGTLGTSKTEGDTVRNLRLTLLLFSSGVSSLLLAQSGHLTTAEAKSHVGEKATICGKVASTHYAARVKGSPTFLNLDESYPNPIFTVLIWGNDRSKFGDPESKYSNKRICVTGLVKDYRGVPEIIVEEPNQISVQK